MKNLVKALPALMLAWALVGCWHDDESSEPGASPAAQPEKFTAFVAGVIANTSDDTEPLDIADLNLVDEADDTEPEPIS